MSQQVISGAFRSATIVGHTPGPVNIRDSGSLGNSWTQGATLIDSIQTQPQLGQVWDILSWTISFSGVIINSSGGGVAAYGWLGKLIAGLMLGGAPQTLTQLPSIRPWVNPTLPLPSGIQNFATLWDGSSDPPFPQISDGATSFPVSPQPIVYTNQLPQSVTVEAGEQMSMALLLSPSLTQAILTAIYNAQYVITYERRRSR